MGSTYGNNIKLTLFGQSHSAAVGMVLDGIPAGIKIDFEKLYAFTQRRAPQNSAISTERNEPDKAEFLSGLVDGVTCGAPVCAIIRNSDANPQDYNAISDTPRPGHADYTMNAKHNGFQDKRGGGYSSGRLTAALCLAGGICMQLLESKGIFLAAHAQSIGNIRDKQFDPVTLCKADFDNLTRSPVTVVDHDVSLKMQQAILNAKENGDSLGGVIECAAIGLPCGIGNPPFDGIENKISSLIFSIPAIKGIEFGNGFSSAALTGVQNNDEFCVKDQKVKTATNNHGGILGGISSGMPLIFRVAVKPTPSVAAPQKTVNLKTMENTEISVPGRHDPCIVPRAIPCVEAACAVALADLMFGGLQ